MRVSLAVLFCFGFTLLGCGGGSSKGTDPAPSPSFSISVTPATLTLQQGGDAAPFHVSVTGQNGFSQSVTVSMPPPGGGLSVTPASLLVAPSAAPGTFYLAAASTASLGQQTLHVSGVAGTLSATVPLQATVTNSSPTAPATMSSLFHSYGGALVHGFYDESRQLLFATNPELNELDVISTRDFSLRSRVHMPKPWGIDQMADGKTLVIGTKTQQIVTMDEDTLDVVQHPYSAAIGAFSLFFPIVTAMANGEVLIIGQEQGVDSDNVLDGGQAVFAWNSNTDTFTQFEPPTANSLTNWETDAIARSTDHKWAIFCADQCYLYSSDSGNVTTASLFAVDPPDNSFGVRGVALSPDGSKIAVASAQQVTFLDRSMTVLKSVPILSAFQGTSTIRFSRDGNKLLLLYGIPSPTIGIVDAIGYNWLGYIPAEVKPDNGQHADLFATDSAGRAYATVNGGMRLVDLTSTPITAPPNNGFTGPDCPVLDAILPLNSPRQVSMMNPPRGVNIYIGGKLSPLLNGGTSISVPASSAAGPANIQCIDSNGNTSVVPDAVSYGVSPIAFSANLLPPTVGSGAVGYLYGYGFSASQSESPAVTLGGQPVKIASLGNLVGVATLQGYAALIPANSPGQSVDLNVSSSLGSGTLASAAAYYQASKILSAPFGIMQLIYDGHRNLLYALRATQIEVLDTATLQWKSPILFSAAANGSYQSMVLTPDNSSLVVAGLSGVHVQLIVIDPDNPASPPVFTNTAGYVSVAGSLAIAGNRVILPGSPGYQFDLSTSTFSALPAYVGQLIRASADGLHLYGADLGSSSGQVYSIDPTTLAVQTERFGFLYWSDLAVSPDGSQFAAVYGPADAPGDFVGFFDSGLRLRNANAYPDLSPPDDIGVHGAMFSPAGKVLVVPLGDALEFWDTATGTLRGRLLTPEELQVPNNLPGLDPLLAIDAAGQTIYAASTSGVSVMKLAVPLDQMTPAKWATLSSSWKLRGSRSLPPRSAVMRRPAIQSPAPVH